MSATEDVWPLVQRLWAEAVPGAIVPVGCSYCRVLPMDPWALRPVHEPSCHLSDAVADRRRRLLLSASTHEAKGKRSRALELRRRAALIDVARLALGEL